MYKLMLSEIITQPAIRLSTAKAETLEIFFNDDCASRSPQHKSSVPAHAAATQASRL
jgi:hypothetical protein